VTLALTQQRSTCLAPQTDALRRILQQCAAESERCEVRRLRSGRIAAEIAGGDDFAVSALVLSEAYFALQHHYAFTKEEALQSLLAFSRTDGIRVAESIRAILEYPNLATAKPGFVDRMIVGEYAMVGSDTYSCEKSFRKLDGTVVISR
jgi:hypothetical protein